MGFNPPPNWPVPQGFTPPPGWTPPADWPPAPPGWQFWIDAPAPVGRPTNASRVPLVMGALAAAVVVGIAAIAGTVWLTRRGHDAAARPAQMLAGTFPTRPQFAWTRTAGDLATGARPQIANPDFINAVDPTPGAVVAGDHILIFTIPDRSQPQTKQLTSLNLSDGHTEWSLPDSANYRCARELIDDLLPCIVFDGPGASATTIDFVNVRHGTVASTYSAPLRVFSIATDGHQVYLGGIDGSEFRITSGPPNNPTGTWQSAVPESECIGTVGTNSDLRVEHGLLTANYNNGVSALLHADDGSPVTDHDVSHASVINDGGNVVALHCQGGSDQGQWPGEILDREGRVVHTAAEIAYPRLDVHAGGNTAVLTATGEFVDAGNGETFSRTTGLIDSNEPPLYNWLVGRTWIAALSGGLVGYDVQTGEQLWQAAGAKAYDTVFTDGQSLIASASGTISAYSIGDGSTLWQLTVSPEASFESAYATDAGLLVVTSDRIGLLRPTGPAAAVPSIGADPKSGETKLVTKCGQPVTLQPEQVRTDSGALIIKMKIVAKCPDGDVLSAPQTRITVTADGHSVASGVFDLSTNPIVIAPLEDSGTSEGSGTSQPSVEHEFRFPLGTFWRLPVSTDAVPTAGSPQPGRVDLEPSTLVVACQEDGTSRQQAESSPTAKSSSTATGPGAPASGDPESASADALRAIANADRPFVQGQLADRWVPQLSSKQPGLVADGISWDNAATLKEHLELRLKYPEVRLLWSGDWSVFSAPDFWVTVTGVTFPDSAGALLWCSGHGFDRDHCYAKLVSTTNPIDGSSDFNP